MKLANMILTAVLATAPFMVNDKIVDQADLTTFSDNKEI